MATSDAQKRARNKWNAANAAERYDRINIMAPKGQKAVIVAAAQRAGENISQYILTAVQARIDGDQDAARIDGDQDAAPKE